MNHEGFTGFVHRDKVNLAHYLLQFFSSKFTSSSLQNIILSFCLHFHYQRSPSFQSQKSSIQLKQLTFSIIIFIRNQSSVILIVKSMNDYPHIRNLQLQDLIDENQQLRFRLSKLSQIENYVEVLLSKIEQYQRQSSMSLQDNHLLKQQIRDGDVRIEEIQKNNGNEMRYVFEQHDQILAEASQTIAKVKKMVEEEQIKNHALQKQHERHLQEHQSMVTDYEERFRRYKHELEKCQQNFQKLNIENQHNSCALREQLSDIQQLKNLVKQKNSCINELNELIEQIERQNKSLRIDGQELQHHLKTNEKQYEEELKHLQNAINLLNKELNQEQLLLNASKQQAQELKEKIKKLDDENNALSSDNGKFQQDNSKLIFLVEETDKENIYIRQKANQLEHYMLQQFQLQKHDFIALKEENFMLKDKLSQKDNALSLKLLEMKQLLSISNSLENALNFKEKSYEDLMRELEELHEKYLKQHSLTEQQGLENKALSERLLVFKEENASINELNEKMKKLNYELESENHRLSRLLSNPRELNRDYLEKVDKLVSDFHCEREDINSKHTLEKQKLKDMYEYERREKQMEYLRKNAMLEEEIAKLKQWQILLSERTRRGQK